MCTEVHVGKTKISYVLEFFRLLIKRNSNDDEEQVVKRQLQGKNNKLSRLTR
jgi:hypothetical protein